MLRYAFALLAALLCVTPGLGADTQKQRKNPEKTKSGAKTEAAEKPLRLKPETYAGLSFRSVGPALTSGRIVDIAVHPREKFTWYVVVASGGVWKTTNAGTTWSPILDSAGSYSFGCVTIDQNDPLTIWVGSGENNSQRSVGYGDGVYLSRDGGSSFENVGLKDSEHIGMIAIDPRDSKVVYVAAQGPLWRSGGDRGLYKTVDGGKSWERILHVDDDTGASEVVLDPRRPDTIYAVTYQRRRHVWTLINGGPGSALHKSIDGGKTWRKITTGFTSNDIGRIGIGLAPSNPDVLYAVVEASGGEGGTYRSDNGGASWTKQSGWVSGGPQYYQELTVDPKNENRIYFMDTYLSVSEDAGKTVLSMEGKYKHVDNHAIVIDADDTDHLLVGCDGGLYESWDRGATWDFKANLPVTQFYKVAVDNAAPFYNIYGGTQDNFTLGGPSRTRTIHGIRNSDWHTVLGGDGFDPVVDPTDPNIVYAQYQYGELYRFDRRSGELVEIQPQPGPDDPPLRWNWDSALILSPHDPRRLYFAAQRVFQSDDRGNSWRPISGDLTRQIDRNKLPVMGRVWGVDAVAKNSSTSFYGNIVALAESPKQAGLLYAGTDDGLIQITEDNGTSWRRVEKIPGVPETAYVSDICASPHDVDTVYATLDHHKLGDLAPYVVKSTDRGRTWTKVTNGLAERGHALTIIEDPVKPGLLFMGTELGFYMSPDAGQNWVSFKTGLPPAAIRDAEIQARENDLVLASFGRGFFVLDDYAPLRQLDEGLIESEAALLPIRDALAYIPEAPLGGFGKSFQGDSFYTADNPPYGALITYYLKESIKTRKAQRQEREKKLIEEKKDVPYPSWDELRLEDREEAPSIIVTIKDSSGRIVRRLTGPASAGLSRVAWDLRTPAWLPAAAIVPGDSGTLPSGSLVVPGSYTASLEKRVEGVVSSVGQPVSFRVVSLGLQTLEEKDKPARLEFEQKLAALQRKVFAANEAIDTARANCALIKTALLHTPSSPESLNVEVRRIGKQLDQISTQLRGDDTIASRNEPTPPSINARVSRAIDALLYSTAPVTDAQRKAHEIAASQLEPVLAQLRQLVENDLVKLGRELEALGAPHTPGRLPR